MRLAIPRRPGALGRVLLLCLGGWAAAVALDAQSVGVRFPEGAVHGFLVLRTNDGRHLADGDLLQTVREGRVTSRALFHFEDGSIQDETAVLSQDRMFRLISYHLQQKGKSFPQSIDMTIDRAQGHVVVRYTDDHGKTKVADDHMTLPEDLADGIIPILLKNLQPQDLPHTLPMVVPTPKPRLVNLEISSLGEEPFSTGAERHRATHYLLKVDIGGLSGWLAPLVGKQPPDNHVWILHGEAPAFVKSEFPLYVGGPIWRIELTRPEFGKAPSRD